MSYKRTKCAELGKDPSTAQTAKVDDNKTLLVTEITREHEVSRVAQIVGCFLASYVVLSVSQ